MNDKYIKNMTMLGHFAAGVVINTLAPLLPKLQDSLGLTIFQSSILPTVFIVTQMIGNLIMGIFIARLGHRRVFTYGLIFLVLGSILGFFSYSFSLVLLTYIIIGFSGAAIYTGLSTIYAELPPDIQNFGLYHASWGLGGMLSPILITLAINMKSNYHYLYLVHILLILIVGVILFKDKSLINKKYEAFKLIDVVSVLKYPIIIIGITASSIYAATEIGSFTWSLNMSKDGYGLQESTGNYIISAFWLFFTVGRILADPVSKKLGAIKFTTICSFLTSVILIVWLLGINAYLFPLLGLTFGPVFPVLQKYINGRLKPQERGLYNGVLDAGAGLAATIIVPIMGSLGDKSMYLAYVPILVLSLVLVVLIPLIKKLGR